MYCLEYRFSTWVYLVYSTTTTTKGHPQQTVTNTLNTSYCTLGPCFVSFIYLIIIDWR
jgi:hypothetical protein